MGVIAAPQWLLPAFTRSVKALGAARYRPRPDRIVAGTLLAAAAQLGVEAVLQPLCKVLELDEAEVRKSLEQTDGAQLDSLMQQLEEGAADDTGTEADHAV